MSGAVRPSSRVWLASGSPRRRDLLTWAGVTVDVHPTHIPEDLQPGVSPIEHALSLALDKAAAARAPADRLVLAADTVVHREGRVFDKPVDRDEAEHLLAGLSGRWHHVTTGVCVGRADERHTFEVTTAVRFRALSAAEIRRYVATGDADDKAGAYGIQGRAGSFVAQLDGDYTNVVGLPLERTLAALSDAGWTP